MMRRFILSIAALGMHMLGMLSPSLAATPMTHANAKLQAKTPPLRAVQVDLDYVYDADPAQQEKNLSLLVTRIQSLGINTVFLQAFANPEGDGLARELYFGNRTIPVRADLFARAVTQLQTQARVKVFGWLPVLSFNLDEKLPRVLAWNPLTDTSAADPKAYQRLSPFDLEARQQIISIYEDMAQAAPIDGVLFHDDAMLSDFEDASEAGLAAYRNAGLPSSIKAIRASPRLMAKWTKYKTNALIAFTQDIANHVRAVRPKIVTVRNIYAPVALQPESQTWFAQNYDHFLNAYDYTAVMAMPAMENVPEDIAEAWMQALVAVAANHRNGLKRTFFELQAVDWRKQSEGGERAIPTQTLAAEMRYLKQQNALNFGYYPDDFVTNTPDAAVIHKDFSLQTNTNTP